jgi:hypothetical protein
LIKYKSLNDNSKLVSSSLIKKIIVIGHGGVALAEFPQTDDDQTQLESGLLTAIMTFAKEVHKSQIETLSFHDRTVCFIPSNTCTLIVQYANILDNLLMSKINEKIKLEADHLLANKNAIDVPDILDELLEKSMSQEWIDKVLDSFGLPRPLLDAEIIDVNNSAIADKVNNILKNMNGLKQPFMVNLSQEQKVLYVLPNDYDTKAISLDISEATTLFRLAPILNKEVEYLKTNGVDLENVIDRLIKTPDLGWKFSKQTEEAISMTFVNDLLKKKMDRILSSIVKGEPVIIIGDKLPVRIVVLTLQLFSTHLYTEVIEWLREDSYDISNGTNGMSMVKFDELINAKKITADYTVVDLHKKKVIGGEENGYLKHLFKDVMGLSLSAAKTIIQTELDDIVNTSLNITELLTKDLETATQEFKNIQSKVRNKDKFSLIVSLSSQRNPVLQKLVDNISDALTNIESYLTDL